MLFEIRPPTRNHRGKCVRIGISRMALADDGYLGSTVL